MKLHKSVTNKKSITGFQTLIKRFENIHGNRYDYSEVEYINGGSKITIICAKHGLFQQAPEKHLLGNGCPKCSGKNKTTDEFVLEIKNIHGNRYDYSEVEYINTATKIKIICKEHGVFEQFPSKHLGGKGCPKCVGKNKTTEELISEFNILHQNKYDYSEVEYTISSKKVNVICKKHGVFSVSPNNHLKGSGCPTCAINRTHYDVYKNQKTILYYIKIDNYYKIGLTKSTVSARFKKEIENGIKIQIIKTFEFDDGWAAFKKEQQILKDTKHFSILKEESPIKGGWTEVRNKDILEFL